MAEIPESLLRRSAEAKARALGVPVEQVLAEMKGEGPPVEIPESEPEQVDESSSEVDTESESEPVDESPDPEDADAETPEIEVEPDQDVAPEEPKLAEYADETDPEPVPEPTAEPDAETQATEAVTAKADSESEPPAGETGAEPPDGETDTETESEPPDGETGAEPAEDVTDAEPEAEPAAAAVAVAEKPSEQAPPSSDGSGNGKVASVVSPRPSVPPTGTPEGVRTQRLLTVVKARAIQDVKAEPADKVNTWPHLMLMEFGALLAITGLLVIMSVVIHSPLLDPANFNATPNPSKAPWYFLGLQELLSYFDPQIAGVMVPTFTGLAFFVAIPFLDRNPSTRPSDRKFAIALYSIFLAGAATLTIIGVLFRGQGFNFSYPWQDGVFFDDLKDWVNFE